MKSTLLGWMLLSLFNSKDHSCFAQLCVDGCNKGNNCTAPSKTSDPYNCSKYYLCDEPDWSERYCDPGLYFDKDICDCSNDGSTCLQCPSTGTTEIPTTDAFSTEPTLVCVDGCNKGGACSLNEKAADPSNCSKYYSCTGDEWEEAYCEPGSYFDKDTCICSDENGNCLQCPGTGTTQIFTSIRTTDDSISTSTDPSEPDITTESNPTSSSAMQTTTTPEITEGLSEGLVIFLYCTVAATVIGLLLALLCCLLIVCCKEEKETELLEEKTGLESLENGNTRESYVKYNYDSGFDRWRPRGLSEDGFDSLKTRQRMSFVTNPAFEDEGSDVSNTGEPEGHDENTSLPPFTENIYKF